MSMKIVVGVDGSEPAKRALDWCATFAGRLDAEVVAVHAIDLPVIVAPMTTYVPIQQFTEVNREELREVVTREWCAPLSNASVPFRVVLKEGDPAARDHRNRKRRTCRPCRHRAPGPRRLRRARAREHQLRAHPPSQRSARDRALISHRPWRH